MTLRIAQGLGAALLLLVGAAYAAGPVGRLPGNLSVTPGGQAAYDIPIKVPAGTNGMAPNLAMHYASAPGNGLAGVGWTLTGQSAITRCSHSKVIDGSYDVDLTLSATDKLCLDGQRLLSAGVGGNRTSGGWIDTATLYTTQLQNYKKITATLDSANHQPQQFTVFTKDGRVLTYGGTIDSRIVAGPVYDNVSLQFIPSMQVISWLLSSVKDRNGNTMTYSYSVDANNSSALLSSIVYSSNPTASTPIPSRNIINFDYSANNTVPYGYVGGSRVRNNGLLTTIRISSGDVAGGTVSEVRRYSLNYRATTSQLTKRPLLASVQECDTYKGVQQCLPATTFAWADGTLDFNTPVAGPAWADTANSTSASWNCAGTTAVNGYCLGAPMVSGTADTWNGDPSYFATIRYGDINGDGKTDICGRTSAGLQCFLSTGSGFSTTPITVSAWSDAGSWNQEKYYSTIQFADINGDGRADICGRGSAGLVCYLGQAGSAGFSATPVTFAGDYTDAGGWSGDATHKYYYTVRFMDLDQDGRSDVCGIGPNGLSCYYIRSDTNGNPTFVAASMYNAAANSPPSGYLPWSSANIDFTRMVPTLMPLNMNRSRDIALCARGIPVDAGGGTTQNGHLKCVIPLSAENATAQMYEADLSQSGAPDWRAARLSDVNGDGWTDLCVGTVTAYACQKNSGQGGPVGFGDFGSFFRNLASQSVPTGTPSPAFWDEVAGFYWLNVMTNANNSSAPITTPAGVFYAINAAVKGEPNYATLRYVDINGDGLADACERAPDGFHCRMQRRLPANFICTQYATAAGISTSTTCGGGPYQANPLFNSDDSYLDIFSTRLDLPVAWSDWGATHWNLPQYYLSIEMVDVTGDGIPDVCGRGPAGITCYSSSSSPRDLVSTITDGYGQQTQLVYKPLTDASVYTKGTLAVYPNVDLQPAKVVVSAVKTGNGLGGFNQTDYAYAGLITNIDYGVQGFAMTETRDEATGYLTDTYFQQTFPFTGMVSEVDDKLCPALTTASADCFVLSKKSNAWAQVNVLPAPHTVILPYVTQSTAKSWDFPTGAAVGPGGVLTSVSQTTLSVSLNPVPVGASVQLTAQVSNGTQSTATGTVSFWDGNTSLGTAVLSNGAATLTTGFSTVGTHNLTASYSGDGNGAGSVSTVTSLVVQQAPSTVSLTVSPGALVAKGQSVTLTAAVAGQSPTGSVTFMDGTTALGVVTLSGGTASFATSWSVNGSHSLTAVYGGDIANAAATSSVATVTVGQVASAVALSSSAGTVAAGTGLTLTATVSGYSPAGTVTFNDGNNVLGAATINGSGVATLATALGTAGTHNLTASYGGDSNNTTSTSTATAVTVTNASPTITLSSNPTAVYMTQSVSLMATLSGGSGSATGTVTFSEGSTVLGTGTLNNGVATLSYTWSTSGLHTLTAAYAGDANNNAATSTSYTMNVTSVQAAIAVNASNISQVGQSNTLRSKFTDVSTGNSISLTQLSGTVTYLDGAVVLGATTPGGQLSVVFTTAGNHSLSARYDADSRSMASSAVSAPLAINVSPQNTNTSAPSLSSNTGVIGDAVTTMSATVTGMNNIVPSGTITFSNQDAQSVVFGTVPVSVITGSLKAGASLTAAIAGVPVGTIHIKAAFTGDANNLNSSGSTTQYTVTKKTAVAVLSATPTSAAVNQSVSLSATVTGYNPTGTVTFKDGTTTLGTATLSNGMATLTQAFTVAGSHSLTVTYGGDTNNTSATSSAVAVTVSAPSIVLAASPTSVFVNQSSALTATVTGYNPTGNVTFKDGTSTLATVALSGGVATLGPTFATAGSHSLTAVYNGDANNASTTSSAVTVTASMKAASVTLTASPTTVLQNQASALTATVTGNSPTGTITFKDGTNTLGTATLSNGVATLSPTFAATGSHSLTAVYSGDSGNTTATSSAVAVTVKSGAPTIAISASPTTRMLTQSVTLTATLSGGASPTGTVTFMEGATTLGSASVSANTATLSWTPSTAGTHTVVAVYNGDTNNLSATSASTTVTVTPYVTTTAFTVSPNPVVQGNSASITATISGSNPTGTVTLMDGSINLGAFPITTSTTSGSASWNMTATLLGNNNLTLIYGGDGNNAGSTSPVVVLAVNPVAVTVDLTANVSPAIAGELVTLTASLGGGSSPTGTVTFRDGTTVLGTAAVQGTSGARYATFGAVFMAGSHSLTASYGGDTNSFNNAATSPAMSLYASKATPSILMTATPNPVSSGQSVTLTAALGGASPTGTITFKDGATTLGTATLSGGVASLTTTLSATGVHSLTASYGGDANNNAVTSDSTGLTVAALFDRYVKHSLVALRAIRHLWSNGSPLRGAT